ncbi:MAG TPA: NADH-quinone oxidoreductase subunit C [Bacteroidia bacterium]|nr:NADH-quinone oxidoreductase subunit C [Bacteroidia bacterium]
MTREELQSRLPELVPGATFEEGGEWLNMKVDASAWKELPAALKSTPGFDFDYLFCLTCVDWKTHLTMVYHMTSTTHRHHLVVKIQLDRTQPEVETVCHIWRTAEFHEREVFELFGVTFLNHPDLRNLILPDVWDGYPLRKDYEDPINMIKL